MKKYSREWWESLDANRVGKETEKIVEALFNEWNTKQCFAWHRMPDARSARGALAAQPGDYVYFASKENRFMGGFIEVKASKHPFRIAKDKVRQLPKLRVFDLAGADNIVLVHHYLEGVWRAVHTADLEVGQPSWDLSDIAKFPTPEEALNYAGISVK